MMKSNKTHTHTHTHPHTPQTKQNKNKNKTKQGQGQRCAKESEACFPILLNHTFSYRNYEK